MKFDEVAEIKIDRDFGIRKYLVTFYQHDKAVHSAYEYAYSRKEAYIDASADILSSIFWTAWDADMIEDEQMVLSKLRK